jgi:hypothetical protein
MIKCPPDTEISRIIILESVENPVFTGHFYILSYLLRKTKKMTSPVLLDQNLFILGFVYTSSKKTRNGKISIFHSGF